MIFKVAHAELQGASHNHDNTPCQDKTAYIIGDDWACVALADGAGSKINSDIGAETAVNAVCEYFKNNSDNESVNEIINCDRILDYVIEKLKQSNYVLKQLSSTLLFLYVKNKTVIIGHLGDGMIFETSNEKTSVISYPENGAEKNITFLTTDETAAEHFRIMRHNISDKDECTFLLTSDGGADCLFNEELQQPANAVGIFAEWLADNNGDVVSDAMLLNFSNMGYDLTTDDISAVEIFISNNN